MSTYGGRRGPNVSQYLRQLNTIPTEPSTEETFIDEDLSLFTNTQFFDFESGQTTDFQAPPAKPDSEVATQTTDDVNSTSPVGELSLDFIQDFNFPEFSPYQTSPLPPNFSENLPIQPIHPPTNVYPNPVPQQQQQQQPQHQAPYVPPPNQPAGTKRKSEVLGNGPSHLSFEEASRLAAEEDKRRRNTAASARFRVKKKQREQALERTAKDMSEKVTVLEGRIQQLETENKWLKNMILEKNGGSEHIAALLDKGLASKDSKDGSSTEQSKSSS